MAVTDFNVFIVDTANEPVPVTEEVQKANDEFLERLTTEDEYISSIRCTCGNGNPDDFTYRGVILAENAAYKLPLVVLRKCHKCKQIGLYGDIDCVTKILGFSYINELTYEQTHGMAEDHSVECEPEMCAGCSTPCDNAKPEEEPETVTPNTVEEATLEPVEGITYFQEQKKIEEYEKSKAMMSEGSQEM